MCHSTTGECTGDSRSIRRSQIIIYTHGHLSLRNLLNEAGYTVHESRIVRFTWPPFTTRVGKLGVGIFRLTGAVAAFARQSRQVIAVATPA